VQRTFGDTHGVQTLAADKNHIPSVTRIKRVFFYLLVVFVALSSLVAFAADTLPEACDKGELQAVKKFLKDGANPNIANENGFTPLLLAVQSGSLPIVKVLVEGKADLEGKHTPSDATPVISACLVGHLDILKYLTESGAKLDVRTKNGATPLHYAVSQNHKEVVQFLISKGVDVNAKDKDGATPLHAVALTGDYEIATILINAGADRASIVNLENKSYTPYDVAIMKQHSAVAEYLKTGKELAAEVVIRVKKANWLADKNGLKVIFEVANNKGAELRLAGVSIRYASGDGTSHTTNSAGLFFDPYHPQKGVTLDVDNKWVSWGNIDDPKSNFGTHTQYEEGKFKVVMEPYATFEWLTRFPVKQEDGLKNVTLIVDKLSPVSFKVAAETNATATGK